LDYLRDEKKIMKAIGSITADHNPIYLSDGPRSAVVKLSWTSVGTSKVEIRVGAHNGALLSRTGSSGSASTGKWIYDGMMVFLQDVSDGAALASENTLGSVIVNVDGGQKRSG
jgi:hypothetical protein